MSFRVRPRRSLRRQSWNSLRESVPLPFASACWKILRAAKGWREWGRTSQEMSHTATNAAALLPLGERVRAGAGAPSVAARATASGGARGRTPA